MTEPKPFREMTFSEQIVEVFYTRATEICKPAFMAINRAYPTYVRNENTTAAGKFAEAHAQIVQHRNFHKRIVKDNIVPMCEIQRFMQAIEVDDVTKRFHDLVQGQLTMVKNRLIDFAELIVPEEDVVAFKEAVERVFPKEIVVLRTGVSINSPTGIANYTATKAPTLEELM